MKFQDLLREIGIPFSTEGKYTRAGWIQFNCPFCRLGSDPDKPYMGYNVRYGYCHCWRCGGHATVDTLVALSGLSVVNCRELLKEVERKGGKRIEIPRGAKLELPTNLVRLSGAHRRYLERRGFNARELEELWSLCATCQRSTLPWRIIIPIQFGGETVSWTARSINPENPLRYISARPDQETMNHKELLYGEHACRHSVIVTEGPTKVWRIGPGSVATLGTGFSSSQVLKLSKYPIRAVCFDNEPAAQRRARELVSLLEPFPGSTYRVELDSAEDPADASEKEIRQLRKSFLE